jgi:predicted ATPase
MRQLANSLGLLDAERDAMFAAGRRVGASRATRKRTRPLVGLPEPVSNFVGREHERVQVIRDLWRARLVTLVGPSGIGKTRLALEVARATADDYADGVVFVDLAPLTDGGLLAEVVASQLDVAQSDRPLLETVTETLRFRRLLLVLDNCEHLVRPSAEFAHDLLAACRFLRILATSREQLRIGGEVAWRVPP